MGFTLVDDRLSRELTGEVRSPAAEHLERFARGVAVYEMPVRAEACSPEGIVENGVLTALAEAAMKAAATTIVADDCDPLQTRELSASFERPVGLYECVS